MTLVKELREAGASAEFLHGAESRSFIGEKAVDVLAVNLVIGIAGNAGWAALRATTSSVGTLCYGAYPSFDEVIGRFEEIRDVL